MGSNQSTGLKYTNRTNTNTNIRSANTNTNISRFNIIDYSKLYNDINKDYIPKESNNKDYSIIKFNEYYNENDKFNINNNLLKQIQSKNSKFIIVNDEFGHDISYHMNTINYIPNINKNQHIMLYYNYCCKGQCWPLFSKLNTCCKQIYNIITKTSNKYNFVLYCKDKNVFNYGDSLVKLLKLYKSLMMRYNKTFNKDPITENEFNTVIDYINNPTSLSTCSNDYQNTKSNTIDVNDNIENTKNNMKSTNTNIDSDKLFNPVIKLDIKPQKKIVKPEDICIVCNDNLLNGSSLIMIECDHGHFIHDECQEEYKSKCSSNVYCLLCNI